MLRPRGPALAVDTAVFSALHVKNSLYEGGVRVPLVVSGKGVSRVGQREAALVNTVDIFPTIVALAGLPLDGVTLDGRSFAPMFEAEGQGARTHNYTEFQGTGVTGWAVRNARYKLITFADGRQEFYDLDTDIAEAFNLMSDSASHQEILAELEAYAREVRGE